AAIEGATAAVFDADDLVGEHSERGGGRLVENAGIDEQLGVIDEVSAGEVDSAGWLDIDQAGDVKDASGDGDAAAVVGAAAGADGETGRRHVGASAGDVQRS